jgi:uncharacterized sulfatase
MPLAVRWPARVPAGRTVDDLVNLTDLAPTFLEAAGLGPLPEMTGRSLMPLLLSTQSGQIDPGRTQVVLGRERHANVRAGNVGYPIRALRTQRHLYLRNYEPDRWPSGDPPLYGDVDEHRSIDGSPSKQAVIEHDGSPQAKQLFELAFGKRPAEELYDLSRDPWQLTNLANDPAHAADRTRLRAQLEAYLIQTKDPRSAGQGGLFDQYHYVTTPPPSRPR